MTDSPIPADEPVGVTLARWRKRKKLTGHALAAQVGMSQPKISRLETGAVTPDPGDVRLLAEALEMPTTEVERIVELAEQADYQHSDWASPPQDLAAFQREISHFETNAKELRVFQPAVVPGLLQTSEYARAIMSSLKNEVAETRLVDSEIAVSEAVNARMQRNRVLLLPDRELHFVITEQVFRNRVCRPEEMVAQLARLRVVAEYPNVRLRIIPDEAELPVAPFHGFVLADDRWLLVDLFSSSLKSNNRRTVRPYRRAFDALERVALTDINDLLRRYQTRYARMLLPDSVSN